MNRWSVYALLLLLGLVVSPSVADDVASLPVAVLDTGLVRPQVHDNVDHGPGRDASAGRSKRATLSDYDRRLQVEATLNKYRRSVSNVANMYYVSWSSNVTTTAASLLTDCDLPTDARHMFGPLPYTFEYSGITGYMRIYDDIPHQLDLAYYHANFSHLLTRVDMQLVGCAVSNQQCFVTNQRLNTLTTGKVFVCVFGYKRSVSSRAKFGVACSGCERDATDCDSRLCRVPCSSNLGNCFEIGTPCSSQCTDCKSAAAADATCQCVCYYDDSTTRCNDATVSSAQPICSRIDDESRMPIVWVACIAVSSGVVVTVIIIAVVWLYIARVKRSHRRAAAVSALTPHDVDSQFGPDFVPVMRPPAYMDSVNRSDKPPAYDCNPFQQLSASAQQLSPGDAELAGAAASQASYGHDNAAAQLSDVAID